jgi:predicted nucleotidyltransferase
MNMLDVIEQHLPHLEALCRKFSVRKLELFGSAARGDFDPAQSDLDFFVEFEDVGWKGSSRLYFGLLHRLVDLTGRHVDLVERKAVHNHYFFDVADRHRMLVYAASLAKAS